MKNLCLAGGVALNCVGNGRILREGPFEQIWIQPAAGDAGGALGVALFIWYQLLGNARQVHGSPTARRGSLLGPRFSRRRDPRVPRRHAGGLPLLRRRGRARPRDVADLIAAGRSSAGSRAGWSSARGPSAAAASSATPAAETMQSVMNLKIKFRESFRPFAPIGARASASASSSRWTTRRQPLHAARGRRSPTGKRARRAGRRARTGLDKLKVIRSERAGDHPRRLLGPRADGRRASATAASPTDAPSRQRPAAR